MPLCIRASVSGPVGYSWTSVTVGTPAAASATSRGWHSMLLATAKSKLKRFASSRPKRAM